MSDYMREHSATRTFHRLTFHQAMRLQHLINCLNNISLINFQCSTMQLGTGTAAAELQLLETDHKSTLLAFVYRQCPYTYRRISLRALTYISYISSSWSKFCFLVLTITAILQFLFRGLICITKHHQAQQAKKPITTSLINCRTGKNDQIFDNA